MPRQRKEEVQCSPKVRSDKGANEAACLQTGEGRRNVCKIAIDYEKESGDIEEEWQEENLAEWTIEAVRRAKEDAVDIRKRLMKASKRKASPEWSAPLETWLMAMAPNWRMQGARDKAGVRAMPKKIWMNEFERKWVDVLTVIRRQRLLPLDWNRSVAWNFDKGAKEGVGSLRTVHGFCLVGKAWLSAVMDRGPKPELPSTHHGYAVGRRREGAIMVQMSTAWRLRQAGWSWVRMHADQKNAFMCSLHKEMDESAAGLAKPEEAMRKYHLRRWKIGCNPARWRIDGEPDSGEALR